MLYKNDEAYKLTAKDHLELGKKFPKYPVRLVYPKSRIRPSRSIHNILPDKPTSIAFPLYATVKTETGTEQWRYAEHRIIGAKGQVSWEPNSLSLRGTIVLTSKDKELLWWLWKCCTVLEGGENWNQRKPKCAFEDLIGEADKRVARETEMATVKALIYSPQIGLSEKRLREIARAYFITGVDELSISQVKLAIENQISRDKNTGVQNFLDLSEAETTLEIKGNIQKAIDSKMITFMIKNKTWAWVTDIGKKNEPICTVTATVDPNEALYDYYMGNRQFAETLLAANKGEKVLSEE